MSEIATMMDKIIESKLTTMVRKELREDFLKEHEEEIISIAHTYLDGYMKRRGKNILSRGLYERVLQNLENNFKTNKLYELIMHTLDDLKTYIESIDARLSKLEKNND